MLSGKKNSGTWLFRKGELLVRPKYSLSLASRLYKDSLVADHDSASPAGTKRRPEKGTALRKSSLK